LGELAEQCGCTAAAVFYALKKINHNSKKKTVTYSEKSEEQREKYTDRLKNVPRNKRVFIDESGVNACLQRAYGRALQGEPIADGKPGRHFDRVNVIGALGNGTHYGIECYKRSTDGEFFENWFVNCLLAVIPKGCTAIMDNAPFHRKKRLRKPARGKVRLLFLPPYSPDYNPIEKSWANMKRFLRNNLRNFQSVNSAVYDYFRVP
jgi:transposase